MLQSAINFPQLANRAGDFMNTVATTSQLEEVTAFAFAEDVDSEHDFKLTQTSDSYSKSNMHIMTWSSLVAAGVPYLVYQVLEERAYKDFYGIEKPSTDSWFEIPENRDHFTLTVATWE